MKKIQSILAIIFFSVVLIACGGGNIGFYSSQEILGDNEEVKKIETDLQAFVKSMENEFAAKRASLEKKQADWKRDSASLSPAARDVVKNDLASYEKEVQTYQQTANQKYIEKRNELYKDVSTRLEKALKEIADDKGYDYIVESSTVRFAYVDSANNVTKLLKEKFNASK
jgi:outer membrane protein